MWEMISRKNRALTTEDIEKITTTYHNWKKMHENVGKDDIVGTGLKPVPTEKNTKYQDIPWFCKSADMAEIEKNDFILTPGRYVWVALNEDTQETFDAKMLQYTAELSEQMKQEKELDERIKSNLENIGYKI